MHHGRRLSIQSTYTRPQRAGVNLTLPSRTTSVAGLLSSSMSMNHCSLMSGSMGVPQRSQVATLCG